MLFSYSVPVTYECDSFSTDSDGKIVYDNCVISQNHEFFLPELTVEERNDISIAIITVLCVASMWRIIIKLIGE